MLILAIETSCDETSAAVIKDGSEVLSNIVATQTEFHQKYGGIVPEIASRKHIEVINPIIQDALDTAKIEFKDLNAIAVTYGPGLVGSLLVGVCAAKALAYALRLPFIGVNHLEGHIYANFLQAPRHQGTEALSDSECLLPKCLMPFICLLVSGGHTMVIKVIDHGKYETLGRTRDDAAGEAFDKVARVLGLGYPGGPVVDQLAKDGNPKAIHFKRPMQEKEFGYDFSFSGIKTAVVNYVNKLSVVSCSPPMADELLVNICASFQQAVVETLVEKTIRAAKEHGVKTVSLAGGVSANSGLRSYLKKRGEEEGLEIMIPKMEYSTDNAAMIGCAAYYQYNRGQVSDFTLKPTASLKL